MDKNLKKKTEKSICKRKKVIKNKITKEEININKKKLILQYI